jgi:hypothetical protein
MKRILWTVLLAGWLGAGFAGAQESPAKRPVSPSTDEVRRHAELRGIQLEMEAREEKMRVEREMNNLAIEQRKMELERQNRPAVGPGKACPMGRGRCQSGKACGVLMLAMGIINILLTAWVYQDIRRRNTGSGLWIIITLMAGLFGAAVYALVRIGDKPDPARTA